MSAKKYIDPLFEELLNNVPREKRREAELSYGIARRIHEVLLRKGWTKADLARATGKRASIVSRWMSGTHNFTMQTISEIETALGDDILSIKRYRQMSGLVDCYQLRPSRASLLNDGE
ncbi:MAG: helix-turn-helix transcriptional regulator [Bacteroidales bacterium]|nr:helix-turn-helix transcriptional regulator [Bacteroidales bacterium]